MRPARPLSMERNRLADCILGRVKAKVGQIFLGKDGLARHEVCTVISLRQLTGHNFRCFAFIFDVNGGNQPLVVSWALYIAHHLGHIRIRPHRLDVIQLAELSDIIIAQHEGAALIHRLIFTIFRQLLLVTGVRHIHRRGTTGTINHRG